MQLYAKKILGQFASEKLGQFDWILQAIALAFVGEIITFFILQIFSKKTFIHNCE